MRSTESSRDFVTVESPLRFALIGPGEPYPLVLLASGDTYTDLVGYYSLRELGLEQLLNSEVAGQSESTAPFPFSTGVRKALPSLDSFDLWLDAAPNESDSRQKLFSLVYDAAGVGKAIKRSPGRVIEGINSQIASLVTAWRDDDKDAIVYRAQILSTILSLLAKQAAAAGDRNRALKQWGYTILLAAGAAAVLGLAFDFRQLH